MIARDAYSQKQILIVGLGDGPITGFGEACEHAYYQVSVSQMQADLEAIRDLIEKTEFQTPELFWQTVYPYLKNNPFALCALDQAAHDFFGKKQAKTTRQILNIPSTTRLISNYTIGIGSKEEMVDKMQRNPFPIYKIKLGTSDDIGLIEALRKHTKAAFRVDANCAWTAEETIQKSKELKRLGVELIEQPLKADEYEAMEEVYQKSVLPLIADESCCAIEDISKCLHRFHGINIKLMKCGGITPAYKMIQEARQFGLKIMLGCMTEGSIGISAIAQLAPLVDFIDADAALLISNDHSKGVQVVPKTGELLYASSNGLGCELDSTILKA